MSTEKDLPQDNMDDQEKKDQFNDNDEPIPGLPLSAELSTIDPKEMAAIKKRVAKYRERFPDGEPAFKRKAPWRVYIYTEDISLYYTKSLRWAQQLLQNTRHVLELKKNDPVTVVAFCAINSLNEAEVRAFLDKIDEDRALEP
jgi:hypothetical protein